MVSRTFYGAKLTFLREILEKIFEPQQKSFFFGKNSLKRFALLMQK